MIKKVDHSTAMESHSAVMNDAYLYHSLPLGVNLFQAGIIAIVPNTRRQRRTTIFNTLLVFAHCVRTLPKKSKGNPCRILCCRNSLQTGILDLLLQFYVCTVELSNGTSSPSATCDSEVCHIVVL